MIELNTKLQYLIKKIENINNPQILELGVYKGKSTKVFLKICDQNNGHLISVDIDDYSNVSNNSNWEFIHSSDDNFKLINSRINKSLDVIYIDSLHEASHVKKVLYNYYKFLKVGGLCFIDDVSWFPYAKGRNDNVYIEETNFRTYSKILEIYNSNFENITLEFFFEGQGYAIITKKNNQELKQETKLSVNRLTIRNILKKMYLRKPAR